MVDRVLIAALSAAGLAGCYAPDVADCAATCSLSRLCPEGLTCTSGFCRVAGATGTCSTIDAPPMIDGPPAQGTCPPAPMGQGPCTTATAVTQVGAACFTVCMPAVDAPTAHGYNAAGMWRSASIQSQAEQDAGGLALAAGQPVWIGLRRVAGNMMFQWVDGMPLTFQAWQNNMPPPPGTTELCIALTPTGWAMEACATARAFVLRLPALPPM